MVKVFIPPHDIHDLRYLPVLYPNFGAFINKKRLFADRGNRSMNVPVVEIVDNSAAADFLLLPYEYFDVLKKYPAYLKESLLLARNSGKKLLVFDLSDYTDIPIKLSDAWVFRIAEYASRPRSNVIVMPTFVEDLAQYSEITWREKSERPVVGFCGWAGFRTLLDYIKFWLKNVLFNCRLLLSRDPAFAARRSGMYFRIKTLAVLAKHAIIKTNFLIRRSYSSHINTIERPAEELRREYIQNITHSDLALAIRGDANISCRFFEILSLGRVPLFLNTNCVLPLADEIDYTKFVVFADHRDIQKLPEIAIKFWQETSTAEFIAMQKMAREMFEKYLQPSSFLAYVLPKLIGH